MGEMVLRSTFEDFCIFTQTEEKFHEIVEDIPKRYENAEMYSISVMQKKPDWIHNRAVLDFKAGDERYHAQYLMGWYIDKDNVDGLATVAEDYVKEFIAIPKPDRDVAKYFSDENSDNVLNHFFEIAGIEVDD